MRFRHAIAISVLTIGFTGLVERACADEAQTNAPTGVYISIFNAPDRFTVELKTNGVYSVLVTGLSTNSQTGIWSWNAARQQFSLTPSTNGEAFAYRLRILRVDPQQPETLQWIPLGRNGQVSGAIDYVRFKRKEE